MTELKISTKAVYTIYDALLGARAHTKLMIKKYSDPELVESYKDELEEIDAALAELGWTGI